MRKIELLIVIFLSVEVIEYFIASIHCADEQSSFHDSKPILRSYYYNADKARLLKIFHDTNTGEPGHQQRMKEQWDLLHGREMPQTGHELYGLVEKWIKKGHAKELLHQYKGQSSNPFTFRTNMRWTPGMKEKAIKFYLKSDPGTRNHSKRVKELWDREYPNYSDIKAHNLMVQVRYLLKHHGEEFNIKKVNLTEEEQMDLIRCYYKSMKHEGEEWDIMRELFIKKHPQYSNIKSPSLRKKVLLIRQYNPEIEDKILGRVSELNTAHSSGEPGETSRMEKRESTSIPKFQNYDFPGASEQYFDPNRDNAWIDRMLQAKSFSSRHLFSDLDTRDEMIHSDLLMDHHVSLNADTSHQNPSNYPRDHFALPDVGTSHRTTQGHFANYHASPDVATSQQNIRNHPGELHAFLNPETSHQMIHPGNTLEQNVFIDRGMSYQTLPGYPRDDYVFADIGTSHQSSQGHPGTHHLIPDVGITHQNIPGNPTDYHHFPDVETSHKMIHPANNREQYATPCEGTSRQVINLKQRISNKKQRNSRKGKEPVLD